MRPDRIALLALTLGAASTNAARSLEYAATCRGPTATITAIEGLDTPRARAVAEYTLPDAIAHCHYELGRAAGKPGPSRARIEPCVRDFLRDAARRGSVTAEANCRAGTIGIPDLKPANTQKLPLDNSCAEGGEQAVKLFEVLCPGYEGKIRGN
jgi:hypothetical protein